MGIINFNDTYLNPKKVSVIGPCDTKVLAHIGQVIHYFLVVVDGHPIEVTAKTKVEVEKLRDTLIEKVKDIDTYLPG